MINAKSFKELKRSIKNFFYTMLARFKYRKFDYDEVCCCGESMGRHSAYGDHTPRCQKEYAISSFVANKINKGDVK